VSKTRQKVPPIAAKARSRIHPRWNVFFVVHVEPEIERGERSFANLQFKVRTETRSKIIRSHRLGPLLFGPANQAAFREDSCPALCPGPPPGQPKPFPGTFGCVNWRIPRRSPIGTTRSPSIDRIIHSAKNEPSTRMKFIPFARGEKPVRSLDHRSLPWQEDVPIILKVGRPGNVSANGHELEPMPPPGTCQSGQPPTIRRLMVSSCPYCCSKAP